VRRFLFRDSRLFDGAIYREFDSEEELTDCLPPRGGIPLFPRHGHGRTGTRRLVAEFCEFLRCSKKWWLTPIILAILLLTLFGLLGQSVLAPFLYPLF
jgi:hypothetical protein